MPLDPTKLPDTDARVSTSIVVLAEDPVTKQFKSIGAIMGLSRTISRSTTRRRELDSDPPGVAVELIPNVVTDLSITITRAMLNTASMVEAFGFFLIEDLTSQNIPITIREVRNNPNGTQQVVEYQKCFFTSNPVAYDITGDIMVVQEANLDVTTVKVINPGA